MKTWIGILPVLVGTISMPLSATEVPSPETIADGKSLYRKICRDCHGSRANRHALGKSKVLIRLNTEEIIDKLRAVQVNGGPRSKQDIMKSGLEEADILSLGDYIQSLKKR